MGALGRAGEGEDARREGGDEDEAEAEGWFIAAREESCGRPAPVVVVVVLVGGWWVVVGSLWEGVLVREAQQPCCLRVRHVEHLLKSVLNRDLGQNTIDYKQRRECASRSRW